MTEDNKKYVAVVLPPIFDIDEYMKYIGFKQHGNFSYVRGNKKIMISDGFFCCMSVEDDKESGTQVETIKCQLSFIPDIWMMNMLLMQIDFIDELF
jgi:hypothetical protein